MWVPVVAIVDGSPQKHGLHLGGVPIVAPEKIVGSAEPVVVTSVHHEASILRACADLGLTNRLVRIPATLKIGCMSTSRSGRQVLRRVRGL